jgi:hypothetical protein
VGKVSESSWLLVSCAEERFDLFFKVVVAFSKVDAVEKVLGLILVGAKVGVGGCGCWVE